MSGETVELEIIREVRGEWVVLGFVGEIDVGAVPPYREALHNELEAGHAKLILDLANIEFFDSTALGVTVGALKKARGLDGDVLIVAPKSPSATPLRHRSSVRNNFEVTGLTKVFSLFSTVDEAVAALAARSK